MELELRQDDDSGIGWPSYVDFLTAFIFILLLLVSALMYFASGDIEEQEAQIRIKNDSNDFMDHGVPNIIVDKKIIIQLDNGKIVFSSGANQLTPATREFLNKIGALIARHPDCGGIEIKGSADRRPVKNDPEFGNWHLSAMRAESVLRYLYLCEECSYTEASRQQIRARLRLSGQGDISADQLKLDNPSDRRVDIILDCGEINAH
ncbi:MAG TPA: OmpA family protein [Candidatus Angelobacter sp.]|jgi:flagellar motor protein MotB